MNVKIFFLISLLAVVSAATTSCEDDALDTYLNQNQTTDVNINSLKDGAGYLQTAEEFVHDVHMHQYQYQRLLLIDQYAGYTAASNNFPFSGPFNSSYTVYADFCTGPKGSFNNCMKYFFQIIKKSNEVQSSTMESDANKLSYKMMGAMSKVLFSISAHETADVYGPFPYFDYKAKGEFAEAPFTYNTVEAIYNDCFAEIDDAIAVFNQVRASSLPLQELEQLLVQHDKLFSVNEKDQRVQYTLSQRADLWIKLANSVKLRMAMQISKVSPSVSQTKAQEAIGGIFTTTDPDAQLAWEGNINTNEQGGLNPIWYASWFWRDHVMCASYLNIADRTQFPKRMFFMKNHIAVPQLNIESNETYLAMRTGIRNGGKDASNVYYTYYSCIDYQKHALSLFNVTEALFLKAEYELRYGTASTAGVVYEDAIKTAYKRLYTKIDFDPETTTLPPFLWYQVDGLWYDDYISQEAALDIDYEDPANPDNNAKGLVTIGNKWDNSDTKEVMLEKIITQKWLTNYPNSLSAWTDLRRTSSPASPTGYPRIFECLNAVDGDGSLRQGDLIRRMPYALSKQSDITDFNNTGRAALGGDNLQGTRLWWDTNSPNF